MQTALANTLAVFDVTAVFAALSRRWRYARAYNRAFAELNALSGIELADMGLSRCMISRLAHEKARRSMTG